MKDFLCIEAMSDEFKISDLNRSRPAWQTMAGTEVTRGIGVRDPSSHFSLGSYCIVTYWSPWPLVTFFISPPPPPDPSIDPHSTVHLRARFAFWKRSLGFIINVIAIVILMDTMMKTMDKNCGRALLTSWKEREALCATRLDTRVNWVNNIWVNNIWVNNIWVNNQQNWKHIWSIIDIVQVLGPTSARGPLGFLRQHRILCQQSQNQQHFGCNIGATFIAALPKIAVLPARARSHL